MREILFRGKRVGFNEWIEGYYFQRKNNECVEGFVAAQMSECAAEFKPVYPETVGQYTGLTDKNGKKIFEGDIVRETITSYYQPIGKIYYDAKNCQWRIEYVNNIVSVGHIGDGRIYELLGNIYDTPMLLEDNP